jgi:hypothetical protein
MGIPLNSTGESSYFPIWDQMISDSSAFWCYEPPSITIMHVFFPFFWCSTPDNGRSLHGEISALDVEDLVTWPRKLWSRC